MVVSSSDLAAFQKAALNRHNELRALHKTPPLVWSDKLAQSSKAWCEKLAAAKAINHADQRLEGENLAKVTGRLPNGAAVTDMWYNEIKMYDFTKDAPSRETLHFTQVIWFETKELGIHIAENEGSFYIVGRYSPMGNMQGKYKQCVLPPITKLSDAQNPTPTATPTTPAQSSTNSKPTTPTSVTPAKPGSTPTPSMSGTVHACTGPTCTGPACSGPDCAAPTIKENITSDKPYLAKFQSSMLTFHNQVRAVHSANPLVLQADLNTIAQDLAEKLLTFKLGKGPEPKYPDTKYGKSFIDVVGNELPDPKTICSSWYDGFRFYDFKQCTPNNQNGGFTQMVWKSTKAVGFGVFWGKNRTVAVAIYSPAGNYQNQYKDNVGALNSAV